MFDVNYKKSQNLSEALSFLKDHGPVTTILAGGTDVMIDLRKGDLQTTYLLDVSRLTELHGINLNGSQLTIGAAVTISEIFASDTLARHAPTLQKAAVKFAGKQIRNVATIGGNVAHCSPCGDTIPPLLIHEAEAVVVNPEGQRTVTIAEIASGPYHCILRPNEIITHFVLKPKPPGVQFSDFQKIGRRKELSIARMSMAAMAQQAADKSITFVRFALGSCTPTPHRFREIEDFFLGKIPDEDLLWEGGRILSERMLEITGRRPSAVYKEPAIQGLFVKLMYPVIY
jgi:CO/xanthine dehydrogenase FAD-binding subunit